MGNGEEEEAEWRCVLRSLRKKYVGYLLQREDEMSELSEVIHLPISMSHPSLSHSLQQSYSKRTFSTHALTNRLGKIKSV